MRLSILLPLCVATAACAGPQLGPSPEAGPGGPAPQGIAAEVWTHALAAHRVALVEGQTESALLAIIDYSLPSTERRLWVVNIGTREVLEAEFVAHGARSGGLFATQFSNRNGTHQSSLGTFITGTTYHGVRGLSLRLRGVERGINDRAEARGLVIHGTPNVSAARARQGTMGRTEGCPAVAAESARRLIRRIENGVVVFVWYPDRAFLDRSAYLDRASAALRLTASD